METKKKFKSDKFYSTYWWIMKLDPSHPMNKVQEMTGYSKMNEHDEAMDKVEVLKKKVIMLNSNGYIDRSLSIRFNWNPSKLLDKNSSISLFELTKNDYGIFKHCLNDKDFYHSTFIKSGLITFLDQFYDMRRKAIDPIVLLSKEKPSFNKDEKFDVGNHRFKTKRELYFFCDQMIKDSYPKDLVLNFQRKYEERYFS